MLPAIVTLDGVQIGHPVENATGGRASCDQIASIGVSDGVVRGVSARIESGYYVPIIGNAGELIELYANGFGLSLSKLRLYRLVSNFRFQADKNGQKKSIKKEKGN